MTPVTSGISTSHDCRAAKQVSKAQASSPASRHRTAIFPLTPHLPIFWGTDGNVKIAMAEKVDKAKDLH